MNQKTRKQKKTNIKSSKNKLRLSVFRSNNYIYAQVIDDDKMITLASVSEKELSLKEKTKKIEAAKEIGKLIAKKALAKKLKAVVFDRGRYIYHGRVKALAEGAREGGLEF